MREEIGPFGLCLLIWGGPDHHSIIYDWRDGGCGVRRAELTNPRHVYHVLTTAVVVPLAITREYKSTAGRPRVGMRMEIPVYEGCEEIQYPDVILADGRSTQQHRDLG